MAISSLGVGSGIDIRSIVDQLLAAERAPVQSRLDRREVQLQAELSSFGTLKSALSDFASAVETLSDTSSFRQAVGASGNPAAIDVSANGEVLSSARFDVQVSSLAAAQSLASASFAGDAVDLGSGTLTFRFGTVATEEAGMVTGFTPSAAQGTASVEIPAGSGSLSDVRDAVNAAEIGIRASVINDGSGDRLVFSAEETGAANGFVVEVEDDDGNLADGVGLSQLQYNTASTALTRNRAAVDANLTVDGLTVTRPANDIDDLLEGATLSLLQTSEVPVEVRVDPDVSGAGKAIQAFVEAYNELQKQIESVSGFNAESQQGAVLLGNSLVRSVESTMRRLVTQQLDVLDGRSVRALADIGITTTREGTLEVDGERLNGALQNSLEDVAALFGTNGLADGSGFRFESSRSETEPGSYAVEVTRLAERAVVAGAAVAVPSAGSPLVINGDNDEIELTIDGVATGRVTLGQGSYASGAVAAAELQARINGAEALREGDLSVAVAFDEGSGSFSITSERYGSESQVEVTFADSTTAATFGFTVGQTDTGQDVAGSIGGVAAEGFGRFLTGQSGATDGLKIEITGGVTGALGAVTFSRGISSQLARATDGFLGIDGAFNGVTRSINESLEEIVDERIKLDDKLARLETRLVSQFSAMDTLVAQLNQTSSFLTTQLAGLESLARNSGRNGG